MINLRLAWPVFVVSQAALLLAGCSPSIEDTPAYQQACEGSALRTNERRNQALEDGYDVNRRYDCITKESYMAVSEQNARWVAANTPEAIAKRAAEREQMRLDEQSRLAREGAAAVIAPVFVLKPLDANSAGELDLASMPAVGPAAAQRIVSERQMRRFADWADLACRVVELSAAQTVFSASACGLTVDGASFPGAPMVPPEAASLCAR